MKSWLKKGFSLILAGFVFLTVVLTAGNGVSSAPYLSSNPETVIIADVPSISLSQLPPEAKQTLRLIEKGGPFPYPEKDGSIFSNRERLLPNKPRGYYQEYTIPTPGRRDRGARRFVTGRQGEIYYTPDHYRTFYRVQKR